MKRRSPFRLWIPVLLLGMTAYGPISAHLAAQAGQSATQSLLDKAHALEARGRMDMATQTWQQVVLADPNNTEALGGLARAAKLSGDDARAATYINRLRAINPSDPNISRAENLQTEKNHNVQLQQAGKLAQAGQYGQAMQVYREVYGNEPPPGDPALAYYETEAATEDGRSHAIAGLRALSDKFPTDSRYQIQLGRILTYNPKTRPEGRKLLANHPNDPQAVAALKQSLLWDAQNPATAGDIKAYLTKHNDAQLTQALKDQPQGKPMSAAQLAAAAAERARTAEDQAGYKALNAGRLDEAERHFKISLAKNPDNASALAGMGYIRMQQAHFGGAISFLAQAKQDGSKDPGIDAALNTAHFWYTMSEGAIGMNENDLPTAEKNYRAALAMKPGSPEALEGLGGTLLKAQQFEAAVPVFSVFVKVKPQAPHAWRGLILAEYGAGNSPRAIEIEKQIPAAVRGQLMKDPLYLRTLASVYSSVGRDADAQRVLRSALNLPFPSDAKGLETDTQLQFAGLLQQANRLDQAVGLYRQVLAKEPNNIEAFKGEVRVLHAMNQDAQALTTVETMPQPVYNVSMSDPGFEQTVAAIYQSQHRLDVAQDVLEKALGMQAAAGQKPSAAIQIQLAGIYLESGNARQAYPIYRQVLTATPDRLDAWKGLISALHSAGRDQDALAQLQQIPPATRLLLEGDVTYLQTVSSVYAGLGQTKEAQIFMARVRQYYISQKTAPPADIEIQDAWSLYNAGNDTALYNQLMTIGSRMDLTDDQRRTVQTIWTNWAVRRSNQAAAAGHSKRSLDILNAAAQAFPDNPGVIKALAGGYAKAGENKQALAIWKAQDLNTAPASDYKAAIGVALAADDMKDAETWLRFGLDQYPKDTQMLILGAKFEQARGDTKRAAEYYRASLDAMPPSDPGAELATELSHPAPAGRLPNGRDPKDLGTLLAPSNKDVSTAAPADVAPAPDPLYLPSYNNQTGTAPVPGVGNPAGNNVVPSYMSNPASNPGARYPAGTTSLKDYVPQAEANEPIPRDGTETPSTSAAIAPDAYKLPAGVLTPAKYQQEQVTRLTQQVISDKQSGNSGGDVYLPYQPYNTPLTPGILTQNPTGSGTQSPAARASQISQMTTPQIPGAQVQGAQAPVAIPPATTTQSPSTAQPQVTGQPPTSGDVYGPYVPYVPPTPKAVQLGAKPNEVPITDPAVTDVLPTARYSSTAKGRKPPVTNPDAAAANAAAIRRQRQTPPAATGQSTPPPEDYSVAPAQTPQSTAPNTYDPNQQYPQPNTGRTAARARPKARPAAPAEPSPSPTATGMTYPGVGQPLGSQPYPATGPAYPLGQAPSDADLIERRVPPLRGGYAPAEPPKLTERQEAERDLAALEGSYSGWLGGTAIGRYRSGRVGLDRLSDIEASFEASAVINDSVRLTVVPQAVFLNNGAVDPTVYTGSGTVLGSYLLENPVTPAQQFASGVGGELQLTSHLFSAAVGYTPYDFLVRNVTARVAFQPTKHFQFYGERQPVKETQLSFAGLRDPGSATPVFSGNVWGGVMSTGGGVRYDLGDEKSGFYITADGADLTGVHVLENSKFEGSMGAYFLAHTWPEYGKLNVGATLFGEHYAHNERGMSYGLGGYFSPEAYFLAAVPVTFTGHYKSNFHYVVAGSIGVQAFEEDNANFFPLDPALQTAFASNAGCTLAGTTAHVAACAQYPVNSNAGFNYGINIEGAYRIADHWYAGGFLSANNTNNYNTISGGFFIRYMFRPQVEVDNYPTGLFPIDGFRPLRVP